MPHDPQPHSLGAPKSHLARWIHRVLGDRRGTVKFRLQGNHLYILSEGRTCPDQQRTLLRLLPALQQQNLNQLLPAGEPAIYQIMLYGRQQGQSQPAWQVPIFLNQLDRHLEQLYGDRPSSAPGPSAPSATESGTASAVVMSNQSLAKRGNVDAIAAYLSETLSKLGVGVRVRLRPLPYQHPTATVVRESAAPLPAAQRLWITCEASYSPEPSLIAEPVAQQLRELELDSFHDAVVLIQVRGEQQPDWVLRVDLTPAKEILKERARWGEVDAMVRLLNQSLAEHRVGISSTLLKQSTLHLTCSWLPSVARRSDVAQVPPAMETVRRAIAPVLDLLGPQGIHHAVLYGHSPAQSEPAWVEWLNLPASQHAALAEPPLTLARRGDLEAIAFLLSRLLNPDLDRQLATGGIRLKLLPKQDLLHIMCDAAVCPPQNKVGRAIAKLLKSLRLPHINGVRIYGRRAGQKRPQWSYGVDFVRRQRLVPEASPDFAATEALVGDLLLRSEEAILRPDLTPQELQRRWQQGWQQGWQRSRHGLQTLLVRSQLFSLTDETAAVAVGRSPSTDAPPSPQPRNVAIIWGTVGLLLMLQLDWVMGQWLHASPPPSAADLKYLEDHSSLLSTSPMAPLLNADDAPDAALNTPTLNTPTVEGWTEPEIDPTAFDDDTFTQAVEREGAPAAIALADPTLESPLPTFNSPQLDQKIALYYRHLEQYGAPDVLIVGSSRALRGVDPAVLEDELNQLGYRDVTVFNFGVNGATAQVVDLVVRRLLTAEQLPKVIIWADGARALNSGRSDRTYLGMAESEAYQQLTAGTLPIPQIETIGYTTDRPAAANRGAMGRSLQESYQAIDAWLSDRLADRSTVYEERDRVKYLFQRQFAAWLPRAPIPPDPVVTTLPTDPSLMEDGMADPEAIASESLMDVRGFLPLAVEFNPATYYQQYARVSGSYDRDYEAFRLEGQQAVATQAVLDTAKAHNIPIVFVNMPLTDEYLDDVRLGYEQELRTYLVELSMNHPQLIFRDLGTIWLDQYTFFSDPSHLNHNGAKAIARRLAQDPMIPWTVMTEPPRPEPTETTPE